MDEVKTTPRFYLTPGYGKGFRDRLGHSQALRIGNRVEISGQGGWDDSIRFPDSLEDEIRQAFVNVERTLNEAGATWRDVVSVDSFHVPVRPDEIGDAHTEVMADEFRKRLGDRTPIWTEIGVAALGAPGMRVEIRVTAIVDGG